MRAKAWIFKVLLGLKQWWDSWKISDVFATLMGYVFKAKAWTLKDIFAPVYNYVLDVIEKVKAPFKALADWISKLNPFSSWAVAPQVSAEELQRRKADIAAMKGKYGTLDFRSSAYGGSMNTYATGGLINHPEVALIREAGREAVIPLENKARGIPLWKAAGEEMGLLMGSTTNNDNRTSSMNFSPVYNITVNGGDTNTEQRFRQIIEETLADMMSQAERVSFS